MKFSQQHRSRSERFSHVQKYGVMQGHNLIFLLGGPAGRVPFYPGLLRPGGALGHYFPHRDIFTGHQSQGGLWGELEGTRIRGV